MRISRLPSSLPLILMALLSGCAQRTVSVQTAHLGEKVWAGTLSYIAIENQWLVSLGEGAGARAPSNRFFLVRLNVVNGGRADATIPTVTLLDDAGQIYNEIADGSGVPNWMGVVRRIRPGDSENGNIVFDVPPQHYRLRVGDEGDEHYAYVDIPLNFIPQNAALPAPPAGSTASGRVNP